MVLFDASLQNLNDNFSAGVIVRQGSGYTTDGSISYENNLLKYNINTTAGMRCVGNYTTQKIDFSQYDKIKVSGIGNNPRGSYPFTENILLFEISDSPYISYQDASPWGELNVWDNRVEEAIFTRASGVDEVTVDVSDITGEWYIVMGVATQLQKKVTGYVGKIELIAETGGGAGSGYIGNSLVSNKKMVGYNVPTSSVESTKTESVNDVSSNAVSGKPKSGNGFARIKFLREIPETLIGKWIDGKNVYEYIVSLTNAVVNDGTIQLFDVSYLNIDTIIQMHGVFQMKSAQENQYAVPSKHYESGYLYDCVDYSEGKIRAKIRYISGASPLFTIIGTPKIVLRYTKA